MFYENSPLPSCLALCRDSVCQRRWEVQECWNPHRATPLFHWREVCMGVSVRSSGPAGLQAAVPASCYAACLASFASRRQSQLTGCESSTGFFSHVAKSRPLWAAPGGEAGSKAEAGALAFGYAGSAGSLKHTNDLVSVWSCSTGRIGVFLGTWCNSTGWGILCFLYLWQSLGVLILLSFRDSIIML